MNLDLVVLVPDKDIEQAMHGLLARPESLGMRRALRTKIITHPNRDPGVHGTANALLQPFVGDAAYALVVFDAAWQGAPSDDPGALARHVEGECRHDWGERVRCVCIDPEVEVWVWSDSPHVAGALGWSGLGELHAWLRERGLLEEGAIKPSDPKAAFEAATREKRIPPSSSIFGELARNVSLRRCTDPSFRSLQETLRGWFAD